METQVPPVQTVTGSEKKRSYNGDYMHSGRFAEEIAWLWLIENSRIIGVEDFRQLRQVQSADVDYGVELIDGRVKLAEIKSDKHLGVTGNVLFEVLRINHHAPPDKVITLGWGARSPANFLFYYASSLHQLYIGPFRKFRMAVQTYTKQARRRTRFDWVNTDEIKSTYNLLVPWRYCESVFQIYELPEEWREIVGEKLKAEDEDCYVSH